MTRLDKKRQNLRARFLKQHVRSSNVSPAKLKAAYYLSTLAFSLAPNYPWQANPPLWAWRVIKSAHKYTLSCGAQPFTSTYWRENKRNFTLVECSRLMGIFTHSFSPAWRIGSTEGSKQVLGHQPGRY